MANRNWRNDMGGYNSFNQILQPMSYYPNVGYSGDRKGFGGGRGGYRDDKFKRNRKDFQGGHRDRVSPIKRRSPPPYQRSHDSHGNNFRKDSRKFHGKHEVKAPRLTLDVKELSTSSLKHRYPEMFIPSDFFHAHLRWQEVFPLYRTMKLGNHCEFQILNKEIEVDGVPTEIASSTVEDENPRFSAKVMLMTMPELRDLYQLTCRTSSHEGTKEYKTSVTKCIKFLVGSKGKSEHMAIGGHWSPSLDGLDPIKDPNVLINTAIRTCKAQTGIDLSTCKTWYKFLEIHYYRDKADAKKDENESTEDESQIDTVVIFIPDVWSCSPSENTWSELKSKFLTKFQSLTKRSDPVEEQPLLAKEDKSQVEEKEVMDVSTKEEKVEKTDDDAPDLMALKVAELRAELSSRGLDTKGVKNQLVQRLKEAMDKEKVKDKVDPIEEKELPSVSVEDKQMEIDPKPEEVSTETPKKVESEPVHEVKKIEPVRPPMTEKEIKRLEKLYSLNEKPSILVKPGFNSSKDGKVDFVLLSVDSLKEIRSDDQKLQFKEENFEVILFLEQFNEMLQRDCAFYIYKSIKAMPDQILEAEGGEPEAKKSKIEVNVSVRKSKLIPDMHLLFSFSLFDSGNFGNIRDHDLEYIIHSLGLNLSRSQVRKLINKIPNRKGNLLYRDVACREVVEGSQEDVAVLKLTEEKLEKLVELAQGNKAFFEENDMDDYKHSGSLALLDSLESTHSIKVLCDVQLQLIKDELSKIKAHQSEAGTVEKDLRDNIVKVQEKLEHEKQSLTKLSVNTKSYGTLLKLAKDNMEVTIKSITDQFEQERAQEKAKEVHDEKVVTDDVTKEKVVNTQT